MDNDRPAVVCLDVMGTVIADPYREALRAGTGLSLPRLREVVDAEAWPAFERGEIDQSTWERRFIADPIDGALDPVAFNRVRLAGYRWLPGMRPLVEALAAQVPVVLATNYPVWAAPLIARTGLAPLVAGVVASYHIGVRKPDPAFFGHLASAAGEPPSRLLFVDDRPDNCAAARAAGMAALRFEGAEALRGGLRAAGLDLTAGSRLPPP